MKKFEAIRKPIYIAEVSANAADFKFTIDLFKSFIERNPNYDGCDYDSSYNNGVWTIRLYRECAVDFAER